jgi:uncharacterized surface protein with fasciclin (FAS1) repeats
MKKILFALGLTVTAFSLMPGAASAHTYQPEATEAPAHHKMSWQERKCERLGYRIDRLNATFDQTNEHKVWRQQRLIDRQNALECAPAGTITETLANNGNFTTLVAAVTAADLADDLSAPGELTVFAPTDQAFAALPAGTVEALLADIPTLTSILTNHVVAGTVNAEAAQALTEATALSGNQLAISVREGSLYINESKVVLSDIRTTNGVIHVIDAVLVP